jgi:hypothetical protein
MRAGREDSIIGLENGLDRRIGKRLQSRDPVRSSFGSFGPLTIGRRDVVTSTLGPGSHRERRRDTIAAREHAVKSTFSGGGAHGFRRRCRSTKSRSVWRHPNPAVRVS